MRNWDYENHNYCKQIQVGGGKMKQMEFSCEKKNKGGGAELLHVTASPVDSPLPPVLICIVNGLHVCYWTAVT